MFSVPVYQLGVSSVVLTGSILMNAGLPSKLFDVLAGTNDVITACFYLSFSQVLHFGRLCSISIEEKRHKKDAKQIIDR